MGLGVPLVLGNVLGRVADFGPAQGAYDDSGAVGVSRTWVRVGGTGRVRTAG
ncbi:hypothetical protein AB0M11_30280 [Streptomyces sp. NPDC051987]|uniref:hypothetical protein n=1 Tax=Streptomyces sp. NPDC051987 TaxID=3155808 RepID=UPI003434F85E